jgi:hypothetical protein
MSANIAYFGGIVTDGLVLYLDVSKKDSYPGIGTVWNSLARGNTLTGSLVNGVTYNQNSGSFQFNGSNQYINFGTDNIIPNSWTIDCCFKNTSPVSSDVVFARSGGGPLAFNQNALFASSIFDGVRKMYVSGKKTTDATYPFCTSSLTINNSVIYNAVGMFNHETTTFNLYINSNFEGELNINSQLVTTGTQYIQIGCSDGISAPGNFLNGHIYCLRLYNRALSASEILQNYNATKNRFEL